MKNIARILSIGVFIIYSNTGCNSTKKISDYGSEMLMESVQNADKDGDGIVAKYEKKLVLDESKNDYYFKKMLISKDFKKMTRMYEKTCRQMRWKE